MTSQYRIERDRGTKEAAQQIEVLRERWPLAFPVKGEDVRPLAISATEEIAAAMGWSRPYTFGVLRHWKMTTAYCQAILRHDQRIALDGAPAEPVGAEAKDLAANQLARLAARQAAKKPAITAPAAAKTTPALAPPIETPPKTAARPSTAGAVASGAGIKPGDRLPPRWRAAPASGRRTPQGPRRACRRDGTDAGGTIGREALDCRHDGERRQDLRPPSRCCARNCRIAFKRRFCG
jgi:sRNA-binding protein